MLLKYFMCFIYC